MHGARVDASGGSSPRSEAKEFWAASELLRVLCRTRSAYSMESLFSLSFGAWSMFAWLLLCALTSNGGCGLSSSLLVWGCRDVCMCVPLCTCMCVCVCGGAIHILPIDEIHPGQRCLAELALDVPRDQTRARRKSPCPYPCFTLF